MEIQGFIIIFVIAFRSKEQGIRNKDLISLTIIINKPKISLTELRRLIIKVLQDKVLYATELIAILHGSDRNSAVIVRLLCGNSVVRAGIYERRITRIEQIIKKE